MTVHIKQRTNATAIVGKLSSAPEKKTASSAYRYNSRPQDLCTGLNYSARAGPFTFRPGPFR